MNKIKTKKYYYLELLYTLLLLSAITLIVILPRNSINSFYDGISVWATKVLPSLLPFFILTKLLSSTNFIPYISKKLTPITKKLYGIDGYGGYIYLMSIISGYPMGAKITSELYKDGRITKGQAHTITAFTSTSGPLFIIGTIGIALFSSSRLGIIVLVSHYAGALLNGLLYRCREQGREIVTHSHTKDNQNILVSAVSSSITAILNIGVFIALFYMIADLVITLDLFSPLLFILEKISINRNISLSVLSGILEVTTGEIMLSHAQISLMSATIISTALVSFGGLSIHAQAYSYLQDFEMPYYKFFLQKVTHSILSTFVSFLLLCIV